MLEEYKHSEPIDLGDIIFKVCISGIVVLTIAGAVYAAHLSQEHLKRQEKLAARCEQLNGITVSDSRQNFLGCFEIDSRIY